MKLFFIGCSFTHGDDLQNPASTAWPALVAKDNDFFNAAVSGGTNDRNVYQTIKHSDQYDKFYIAWTFIERFTRYRSDNSCEVNFNPSLTHCLYGSSKEFQDYAKFHYRYWYNELYAFKIWLQQIVLLQRYLENKNKPYVMVNTAHNDIGIWTQSWNNFKDSVKSMVYFDGLSDAQLHDEHQEIQILLGEINMERFIGWGQWTISGLKKTHPVGPTNHLLEDGHKSIADYIARHDTN